MIPSAVFFDMDGTFINSEPIWHAAQTEIMAEFGYEWSMKDATFTVGGPLSKVGAHMSACNDWLNTSEYFIERLVDLVALKFATSLEFMPGARELATSVKESGIPIGLVTASPKQLVDSAISFIGDGFFDVVVCSDDVINTKPAPDCYLTAASLLNVDIQNSLILEDSATGVKSAQASGAKVVAIPHLSEIEGNERTSIITTLKDLSVEELFQLH